MKKNKSIIIAIVVAVVVLAIVITFFVINNKGNEQKIEESNLLEDSGVSKLVAISDKMKDEKNYSVSLTLNDENKRITSRKGETAKVEILDEGKTTTYLVKDKTTYLLSDKTKRYYEYKNTTSLLNDFINNIEEIVNKNYTVGTETIDGKEYRYEEFEKSSSFIINYKTEIDNLNTKTRMYFDGDELKYIKTYIGDVEQLLKVEIKYNNQNDENFEIPEEYEKKG